MKLYASALEAIEPEVVNLISRYFGSRTPIENANLVLPYAVYIEEQKELKFLLKILKSSSYQRRNKVPIFKQYRIANKVMDSGIRGNLFFLWVPSVADDRARCFFIINLNKIKMTAAIMTRVEMLFRPSSIRKVQEFFGLIFGNDEENLDVL